MRKILFILSVFLFAQAYSQEKDKKLVSLDALLSETQFSSDAPKMLDFVWWLPREFWAVSNAQDPTSSEKDFIELNNLFEDYELFGIIRGDVGNFGGITYHPREAILKELTVNYKGENLIVVPEEEISADLLNFFMIMQPMLGNMLGQMGNNMHFILFKSIRGNEVLPINPLQNEILTIKLGDYERTVDLPLNSLLKEKKMSGRWKTLFGQIHILPNPWEKINLNYYYCYSKSFLLFGSFFLFYILP